MLCKLFHTGAFVRTALLIAVSVCIAKGDTITASLYSPFGGPLPVVIDLDAITPPSQSTLTGTGYSIRFLPRLFLKRRRRAGVGLPAPTPYRSQA